jgi:hypothetical protein
MTLGHRHVSTGHSKVTEQVLDGGPSMLPVPDKNREQAQRDHKQSCAGARAPPTMEREAAAIHHAKEQ